MGKIKLIIGSALTVLFVAIVGTSLVQAQAFRTGDTVTVAKEDKLNSTLFVSGRTVTIDSEVNGDVFCGGQTVIITGTVHGDVVCAGQTVTVKGKVDGDVRLAGQTVLLDAAVDGSATIGAQSFVLESTGSVGRDMTIGSSDATLKGDVKRDIIVGGENVTLASTVDRNVKGEVAHLRLDSEARIRGNIDYASQNDIQRASGAEVGGKITKSEPAYAEKQRQEHDPMATLGSMIYWFVALLCVAMAVALLLPRMLHVVTDQAFPKPWKALLVGFLASVTFPIIFILLAITLIGLPLAFATLILWIATMLLAGPVFSYYIGRLILRDSPQPILVTLVGASAVIVGSFIPVINIFVFLAVIWLGTGMILLEAFKRTRKPVQESTTKKSNSK